MFVSFKKKRKNWNWNSSPSLLEDFFHFSLENVVGVIDAGVFYELNNSTLVDVTKKCNHQVTFLQNDMICIEECFSKTSGMWVCVCFKREEILKIMHCKSNKPNQPVTPLIQYSNNEVQLNCLTSRVHQKQRNLNRFTFIYAKFIPHFHVIYAVHCKRNGQQT